MRNRTLADLYRVRRAARRRMLRRGARYLAATRGTVPAVNRELALRLYQEARQLFVTLSGLEWQ